MKVFQHVPNFVDGYTPMYAEVKTQAELLDLEWVKSWKKDRPNGVFCLSGDLNARRPFNQLKLMIHDPAAPVEWWWVIAYLEETDGSGLDLPRWEELWSGKLPK